MTIQEYIDKCEVVAKEARAAGLNVRGILQPALGWRPGVLLEVSFTNPAAIRFAEERGYSIGPSQTTRSMAIIETKEKR